VDFSKERITYNKDHLSEKDLSASPTLQFDHWMKEAIEAQIIEPYAMSLATSTKESEPSVRTVLLRHYDDSGLVFYTNYNSKKGKELAENPSAALLFFWPDLERQIRIQGTVTKVSAEVSDAYWEKRPEASRIASKSSPQSDVLSSADQLKKNMEEIEKQGDYTRPAHWGGYILKPSYFEFWQGRPARMHDRLCYSQTDDSSWTVERLAP